MGVGRGGWGGGDSWGGGRSLREEGRGSVELSARRGGGGGGAWGELGLSVICVVLL